MFSRKKRFLRTNVAPYPFYLVMLAIGLLIPGSDNQAHEVSGVSQASYAGAFYGGCRKHASAQYCQCIQDQFGTHLSKAEMIAAMLGAPPHSARMAAHAVPYCRSGQSTPWPPAGELAWPTLDAVHKVHGTYHGSDLSFSDQGYIKKGSASLKCTYRLTLWNNLDYFRGQWRCPGQSGKMTIDLQSKKRG